MISPAPLTARISSTSSSVMELKECYAKLLNIGLPSTECLRVLVAEMLNVVLALGSIIVKLPQVYSIVASSSVEGLSPASFYLDTLVSTLNGLYMYLKGYSFVGYADSVFSTVQNVVLVLLLWYYGKASSTSSAPREAIAARVAIVGGWVVLSVLALHTPADLQYLLQLAIFPLMIWSRGAQIAQNFATKSTGSLSLVSNLLLFLGASAKIFTIVSQNMSSKTSDGSLITSSAIASLLSGTIVIQILIYNDSPPKQQQRKKKE